MKARKMSMNRLIKCIGYDPVTRQYYIDRTIHNIPFQLYHYSEDAVKRYIKSKWYTRFIAPRLGRGKSYGKHSRPARSSRQTSKTVS